MIESETALGPPVISYLEQYGWDVYQEVCFRGSAADIVGVQRGRACIVELKRSLTFEVIAQALEWSRLGLAHWVWIAVPETRGSSAGRWLAYRTCEREGVGVLVVELRPGYDVMATSRVQAALARRADPRPLIALLDPEQRARVAAGSNGGGRWTEFRRTAERVHRAVTEHPGILLKDLVAVLDHHYANNKSARAHIAHWIDKGVIEGLETRRDGRHLRVFPKTEVVA